MPVIDNSGINLYDAVQTGATVFDGRNSNWDQKITKPIDMNSQGLCMLGQYYGIFHEGLNSLGLTQEMAIECGFHVDVYNLSEAAALERLHRLEVLWTTEVNRRRSPEHWLALKDDVPAGGDVLELTTDELVPA